MGRYYTGRINIKKGIPVCYNEIMTRIRDNVRGKKIFVSIDESMNTEAQYVANGKIFADF